MSQVVPLPVDQASVDGRGKPVMDAADAASRRSDGQRQSTAVGGQAVANPPVELPSLSDEGPAVVAVFRSAPPWLISTLIHVLLIIILGLVSVADPVKIVNVLTAVTVDDGPEIQQFAIQKLDPAVLTESEPAPQSATNFSEVIPKVRPVDLSPVDVAELAIDLPDLVTDLAPKPAQLQTLARATVREFDSRSEGTKEELLRAYGGTQSSEAAVAKALRWLVRHQTPSGGWSYQHNLVCKGACGDPGTGLHVGRFASATSLALLPFLGAGQTHLQGDYRAVVYQGLKFLLTTGKPGVQNGIPVLNFTGGVSNMYDQGLAAIVLCEAYAMTQDPDLMQPAQAAVNFIALAQCNDGGWYYGSRHPDGGDTSVTGWQVMALKSAKIGDLKVRPKAARGSMLFLDKVGSQLGDTYGYRGKITTPQDRPGCVAVGLLCRMYLGWDKSHPGIVKGTEHLSRIGVDKQDIYYNYYAAQVLRHYGGSQWTEFNTELRDWLVDAQSSRKGERGSWFFPDSKPHRGPLEGGRLASTALATMILEVYYRHMPLYADGAVDDEFPL